MVDMLTLPSVAVRLPLEIKRRGATYVFVKRGLKCLIYARTVPGQDTTTYEVFKIKIRKQSNVSGKIIPAGEVFPNDEAFGIWAKAPLTLERAKGWFELFENSWS